MTDALLFRGKDAILSGPAGGVVGMVETARKVRFDKLIGFDMGGTSTDVCHYAGSYERSFETAVAGVRIRAPIIKYTQSLPVAALYLHSGTSVFRIDGPAIIVEPTGTNVIEQGWQARIDQSANLIVTRKSQ